MIEINRDIPHTMTLDGLEYLGRMARSVPKNGLILEVGPLFGSSTWVLAKNCHPSVRVISIDTWEPQPWIDTIEAKFPGCKPFSKAAFDYYTADCPNVTAIQGFSPEVMGDFNEPIDLFFDDATHGDPGFSQSLAYYIPRVRAHGIVCGDDFATGWPDIVHGVHKLARSWHASAEVCGRVWALIKPAESGLAPRVYDVIGQRAAAELEYEVHTRAGHYRASPGCWTGSLDTSAPVDAICIRPALGSVQLDGAVQLLSSVDGNPRYSHWMPFGQWLEVPGAIGFRAHITGPNSREWQLHYQAQFVLDDGETVQWRNTKGFKDTQIVSTSEANEWLGDVRFWLEPVPE